MSICDRLDLGTIGSQPVMPKMCPDTGLQKPCAPHIYSFEITFQHSVCQQLRCELNLTSLIKEHDPIRASAPIVGKSARVSYYKEWICQDQVIEFYILHCSWYLIHQPSGGGLFVPCTNERECKKQYYLRHQHTQYSIHEGEVSVLYIWQVLAKDFGKLRVEPDLLIFLFFSFWIYFQLLGTQFES